MAVFAMTSSYGPSIAGQPADRMKEQPAGIIILGGGISSFLQDPALQPSALPTSRVTRAAQLAELYPDAMILYTGRESSPGAVRVLERAGISERRIVWENRSSTTAENARFSAALVHPHPKQNWLLVTDDWHMPRAQACFQRAGFTVTGAPVRRLGTEGRWTRYREALGRIVYVVLGLCG